MRLPSWLLWIVRGLLLLALCTPLVVKWNVFFPFAFGKALFFRVVIELALFLWAARSLLMLHGPYGVGKEERAWRTLFRHPLTLAIGGFFISLLISTIFAVNDYRAFWGDVERSEGFWGMLHYGALFVLLLRFFGAREWGWLMKVLFGGGIVLMFYGVLEYFGITDFPFAVPSSSVAGAGVARLASLVGNSAFLSTHLLLLVAFAGIFWYFKKDALKEESRAWSLLALGTGLLALPAIFFTGTRGAILGLVAGFGMWVVLVAAGFTGSGKRFRAIAIAALAALLVFGGIFWSTRTASFWQEVPGLSRLANTNPFDQHDASTQTRLITWRVSWEAFLDRPVFGWGPENYLMAYERHYDPNYALYGETWLDRAHNKVFDLLVMQGAVGFLAYLSIFIMAFWVIARYRKPEGAVLASGLVAYGVQNLVLFDQVVSYPVIFSLFAFIVWRFRKEDVGAPEERTRIHVPNAHAYETGAFALLAGASLVSLYLWNYVPYRQSVAMRASPGLGEVNKVVAKIQEAITPYNFAQISIRSQAVDAIYLDQYFYNDAYRSNPKFRILGDTLIEAMDELTRREPYDVRLILREAEMIDSLAFDDAKAYERIEGLLRVARELAPRRQEVLYHQAINFAKQGRIDEALVTAQEALDMSPEVPRARFHYALILAAAHRDEEAKRELAYMETLDPRFAALLGVDHNSVMMLYHAWGRQDKMAELVIKSIDGAVVTRFRADYYLLALQYFAAREDAPNLIKVATFIGETTPELKDDMEVIVDLARKAAWHIISNL